MSLQKQIRSWLLTTLKYTLNPFTRRLAYTRFGPFAIIRHIGRRSGKPYETPIIARHLADGFVIELTYGDRVDWYKNVQAARGCTVVWHGQPYPINHFEPLAPAAGRAAFSTAQQFILRLLKRHDFVKLSLASKLPVASNSATKLNRN
jgi:deazaflavin-dependent oxidoreductase (nitroreductase family)